MTRQEAEQYRRLMGEIFMCKENLAELEAEEKQWADYPETVKELEDTRAIIQSRLDKCIRQCDRFEKWLAGIANKQIQAFVFARYVEGLSWTQIAVDANMPTNTIQVKMRRYFAKEAEK